MDRSSSLYQACSDLFVRYPLAVEGSGRARWIVLAQQDGNGAAFFVLTRDDNEDRPLYSLGPWRASGGVEIGPDAHAVVPKVFANAVEQGVPIPRHGSLFGWDDTGAISALIASYSQYTPETPEPSWAAMPIVGIPEARWPAMVHERIFGTWFWEAYRVGRIVALDGLIAENPRVVFWVDTVAILGSGCCAVARDIRSGDEPMLRRGRYVYYQAQEAGKPVPSLEALLADDSKIDLAARFV
jgi:hypothetical protein